jgi:predicted nucleic acid-binding Zn ribbon protein
MAIVWDACVACSALPHKHTAKQHSNEYHERLSELAKRFRAFFLLCVGLIVVIIIRIEKIIF